MKKIYVYKCLTPALRVNLFIFTIISFMYASDSQFSDGAATGFHLLEEPLNSRCISMGAAGTALAGSSFSFYNPASPFLLKKSYLHLEYSQYPRADYKDFNLESALSIKNISIGLLFKTGIIKEIFPVNDFGNLPDFELPFSSQLTQISLALCYSKWESVAIGVCANGIQDRIAEESAYAITASAGILYNPIQNHLTFGLSALNMGITTPMTGKDSIDTWGKGERLPFTSRFGVNWNDTLKNIPYSIVMDIVYRDVYDRSKKFSSDIQDRFTIPAGLEICVLRSLALRMGKRFLHPVEAFNFGIGFITESIIMDASFVIPRLINDTEFKWRTAITYLIDTKKTDKKR